MDYELTDTERCRCARIAAGVTASYSPADPSYFAAVHVAIHEDLRWHFGAGIAAETDRYDALVTAVLDSVPAPEELPS